MKKSAGLRLCSLLILLIATTAAHGEDWPTYRHDKERSGMTAAQLKLPLTQHWVYASAVAPQRAWSGPQGRTVEGKDLYDRVKFDDAFQIAVVGPKVFFGSSVDHKVYCLDAASGKTLWTFCSGAPIRLAPTVAGGRVFIGSEDGYAYCLDADSGAMVWKLRLGPADERIIGRGEMISRWPVRTGVLVDEDVAYFGAGIFPHENVYLCAASAADGKVLWRNDNISHQSAGRNDLSPQGYLLATADQLHVPSGRSRPRSVNRKTGKLGGSGAASVKLSSGQVAGTNAILIDGRLHMPSLGAQMAGTGDATFVTTGGVVARLDRKTYAEVSRQRDALQNSLRGAQSRFNRKQINKEQYDRETGEIRKKIQALADGGLIWRTECSANAAVIAAGDLVLAGGKNEVLAFDAATGEQKWKAEVDGEARGLAAVTGRLLVSTTTGKVYCFGDATTAAVAKTESPAPPDEKDEWTAAYQAAAERIVKQSGVSRGFCLVVGSETGRLARELAKRSELKIYGIEPDGKKVAAARGMLSRAGLYGHRVVIHQGSLNAIPFPSYFANLIVSDTVLRTGELPVEAARLTRHLKPAGGVVCLGRPPAAPGDAVAADKLTRWLSDFGLDAQGNIAADGPWATLTRGTLPGAGNWSHQYAEPGNTANSGDKIVKGGMGVLWYGDPGPGKMVNRHQGAVGPLVVNGRLFVQGTNSLMAYDAYNGLFLWEVANPKAIRTGVFQNRAPGNLAANEHGVFHMVLGEVIEHDAATGKVKKVHKLPPDVDGEAYQWGYVAVRDGLLFGTATMRKVVERVRRRRGDPGQAASDRIFAIDLASGAHLWNYQGKSIAFETIALGPDRVFFIDSTVTSEQRAAILRQDKSELEKLEGDERQRAEQRQKNLDVRLAVALNARTGETIWSKPVDVTDCSEIGIGGGKLTLMYHKDVLILGGANANGHYWKQFVSGEFKRRRLVALYALDGYKMWAKDANYRHRPIILGERVIAEPWAFDLTTGKQMTRNHPLTGKATPWSMMRPGHHCGMLTACDNMLLFRSGYTGFYDLEADAGTRHFAGHRLGCWINAIPTNGLVVVPEASAGCVCMFSIASTIVMEPRPPRRPWSLYSGVGPTTPVKQMALNFGAPGDRRDRSGQLWLAYPRPVPNPGLETSLDLKLKFDTKFAAGGGFFSHDGDAETGAAEMAWIVSSGARGLTRCVIPLLGKDDAPASYNVRLYFAQADSDMQAEFVAKVQDKIAVEVSRMAAFHAHEAPSVQVSDNLTIELSAKDGSPPPILSGIEITRADVATK